MHVEIFQHCPDTTEVRGIGLTEIGNPRYQYQVNINRYITIIVILRSIDFAW